jgi:hypothetical protein
MFEQALILRAGVEKKIDLGLVAETRGLGAWRCPDSVVLS